MMSIGDGYAPETPLHTHACMYAVCLHAYVWYDMYDLCDLYVCMYVRDCVPMYVCMYVYIHRHIDTICTGHTAT